MSRIDDLLSEHCPEGVEIKPLGQVGQFIRGNGLQKKDFVEEGVGCIHYGQIYTHYGTSATVTKSFVTLALAAKLRSARPGDLVVTTTSENIEDVGKAVAWLGEGPIAIGGHSCSFTHSLDPLYAAYYFQTDAFHRQKRRFVKGTKVKELSTHDLARIEIPVPPIAIQREIVSILTRMEALEAELEAELEARRRQYAHYRDLLIGASVTEPGWVTFGDVATIVRGGSPRPIQAFLTLAEDGVNWIKIGDVPPDGKYVTTTEERIRPEGAKHSRLVVPGDFILSNSMSFGRPYIMRTTGCIHDGWLAIKDYESTFSPDFLYHSLRSSHLSRQMKMKASSGTVSNLNADVVKSLVLPAPPLADQEGIVAILDRFEALTNDISIGLPAELVARRQQYEYYRNRLFDFSRLAA